MILILLFSTTNSHGCELPPDGAVHASERIFCIISREIIVLPHNYSKNLLNSGCFLKTLIPAILRRRRKPLRHALIGIICSSGVSDTCLSTSSRSFEPVIDAFTKGPFTASMLPRFISQLTLSNECPRRECLKVSSLSFFLPTRPC